MKKYSSLKWATLIIALALVVAGCSSNNNEGTAESGGSADATVFKLNLSSGEPPSLDPSLMTDSSSYAVARGLFEGLTRIDESGAILPGIAESWDISENGLTYTFHLRNNAKWSNGDPVTAGDFVFSWTRTLKPETASEYAYQLYYIAGAEEYNAGETTNTDGLGIKAVDDYTLEVTLKSPAPYFLGLTSFFTYYPEHQSIANNPAWATDADSFISNGPYKMSEWSHNNSITLVPDDNYYAKDEIKFTKVEFSMVSDSSTELNMYETGELDYAGAPQGTIPTDQIAALQQTKGDELKIQGTAGMYFYQFNTTEPPFNNAKIRKAFAMSINRQTLIDSVTMGGQTPAFGFVPPGLIGEKEEFRTEVPDNYFTEDAEEAKKLLAEGMQELGLTEFPQVSLTYNTDDNNKKIAEAIVEMWRTNLGVDVGIENQEWGVFLQNRNSLNYQIARSGWFADYDDPMTFIDLFSSWSGNNGSGFANDKYDALVKEAYATNEPSARMKAMAEAEKILMDEMPIIPLYYYTNVYMIKPDIKGVFNDFSGAIDWTRGYRE